jgi:splicing factor 3B subunit 3
LLAGIGRDVVSYEMGLKQLLRRGVSQVAPTRVTALAHGGATAGGILLSDEAADASESAGQRVWCADGEEGVLLLSYRPATGKAVVIADELTPRHVSGALSVLDADSVAVGDKFGSVAVIRAPDSADDDGIVSGEGAQTLWDASPVRGAPTKLVTECQMYCGAAVTAVSKTALGGGHEAILYGTVTGAVGALLPIMTKSDARLLEHLEMYLRARAEVEEGVGTAASERLSPTGRVHVAYRSTFAPVRHIIDGDLCERFSSLPEAQRLAIAEELSAEGGPVAASSAGAASAAVVRRLEELRGRVM